MPKSIEALQKELEQTQQALGAAEDTLQQFAYRASHDLGEPLRTMKSYVQLIERRYNEKLDKDGKEFIAFVVDGANRMADMLEGLRLYSRVTTRGQPFKKTDCEAVFSELLISFKQSLF